MRIKKNFWEKELEYLRRFVGEEIEVSLIRVTTVPHKYEASSISWWPYKPRFMVLEDVTKKGITCSGKFIPFTKELSKDRILAGSEIKVYTLRHKGELIYDNRSSEYGFWNKELEQERVDFAKKIRNLTKERLSEVKKYVGRVVEVEVYHIYDTFHNDDIDHCGHTELIRGPLNSVTDDGIIVSERPLKFNKAESSWSSIVGETITLILCKDEVLYDHYDAVHQDIEHKLERPECAL